MRVVTGLPHATIIGVVDGMTTRDVLRIVRRYLVLLILTAVVGTTIGVGVFFIQPREYAADAKLFVSTSAGGEVAQLQLGASFSEQRAEMYAELADTPAVLDQVIEDLDLRVTSSALAQNVDAQVLPGTSLLEVTATGSSPQQAADLTDALVQSISDLSVTLEELEGVPADLLTVTVIESARVPQEPVRPNALIHAGAGLAVGLVVGVGIALFRHSMDSRVRDESDIAEADGVLVIRAPHRPGGHRRRSARDRHDATARSEAIGALASHLALSDPTGRLRTVVVTSAVDQQSNHLVIADLAQAAALTGLRVLVIDADVTSSPLSASWNMRDRAGLLQIVQGDLTLRQTVGDSGDGYAVLPAGYGTNRNILTLMQHHGAGGFSKVLDQARESYDLILISTAAVLLHAEVVALARSVDGTVVMTEAGTAERSQVSTVLRRLRAAHVPVLAVVLLMPIRGADRYRPGVYHTEPVALPAMAVAS